MPLVKVPLVCTYEPIVSVLLLKLIVPPALVSAVVSAIWLEFIINNEPPLTKISPAETLTPAALLNRRTPAESVVRPL